MQQKNRFLMLIPNTLSSLRFIFKSYEPEKSCPIFQKGENTPNKSHSLNKNHTIKSSVSENPTLL